MQSWFDGDWCWGFGKGYMWSWDLNVSLNYPG